MAVSAALLSTARTFAGDQMTESELAQIPIQQLFAGEDRTALQWDVRAADLGLTYFQRLGGAVVVRVPAKQLFARLGAGWLIVVVHVTDAAGHMYAMHITHDLTKWKLPTDADQVAFRFDAFVLPGDYTVAVMLYDSATKESNLKHLKLRVAAAGDHPLPDEWNGLPAIEFWPGDSPYSANSRLNLILKNQRPARIEIILNTSLTLPVGQFRAIYLVNLDRLLPQSDVLGQMRAGNALPDVTVLDLAKQQVLLDSDTVNTLDWSQVRSNLSSSATDTVSVNELRAQKDEARFFVDQVERRISPEASANSSSDQNVRVLIVLSGPMAFSTTQDMSHALPCANGECKAYYIRSHVLPPLDHHDIANYYGVWGDWETDELERTLASLNPRVFDVYSPEDFQKAIATIISDSANW